MFQRGSEEILRPLARWFIRGHEKLPWRSQSLSKPHAHPYHVLVSEFMLQQTQVKTVIPYFQKWIKAYPSPAAVVKASSKELLRSWEGLGYYRRCTHLQKACRQIVQKGWPKQREEMLSLPGVGEYTASALGAIAFLWPTPALDGNVVRIISRLGGLKRWNSATQRKVYAWLVPSLSTHGPSIMSQALMDLGRTICKSKKPDCPSCPLRSQCYAFKHPSWKMKPSTTQKKIRKESIHAFLLESPKGFLIQKPLGKGLLGNCYQLPLSPEPLEQSKGRSALKVLTGASFIQRYSGRVESVTPIRIILSKPFRPIKGYQWIKASQWGKLALGVRDRKVVGHHTELQKSVRVSRKGLTKFIQSLSSEPLDL